MATTTAQQGSSPFIKQLASSNRTTRDRAVSALRTFLKRNAPLSATECLKLWKGLYYTMWMSDKPRNQQQLARDLADLMHVLPTRENFLVFVDGFWQTMSREWASIDALRMDKFLYLVRCYVQEGFQYVRRAGWDVTLVEEYMNVLETTPFELRSVRIPNGLRYHVVDLYVDELDKADEDSTSPVERLIAPMKKMAKDSPNKTARKRATEALDDERLGRWKTRKEIGEESEEEEEEEEEEDEDEEEGEGEDGEFGGFDD